VPLSRVNDLPIGAEDLESALAWQEVRSHQEMIADTAGDFKEYLCFAYVVARETIQRQRDSATWSERIRYPATLVRVSAPGFYARRVGPVGDRRCRIEFTLSG
jgi:hypothetical protein